MFAISSASSMRYLLDSQAPTAMASAEHGKHHMSKKRLLVITLTSTTAFIVAIAILLLLLRAFQARKRRNSESSMKIWTNQLHTMQQRRCDNAESSSSDTSGRGSARFEATKFWPWPSYLNETKSSCVKSSSAGRSPCCLTYAVLQAATNNFSSSNLLGEGSFGLVYKARLDYDAYAAVKRLTGAGQHSKKEFQGEVDLMSKIRHPNLVALLGYSSDGPEPLVVYELMQNGSLHDQLHGPSCGTALTWSLRLKIALEAARGLEHLHQNCKPAIIHRDFKASNILLDASFNAKVSDFGLAVALEETGFLKDDVQVQGTFGYIAPEYLMDGTLTEKSDVYGFGVVLLELLTGRLPVDTSLPLGSQSLVTWVTPVLTNREKLMEILDSSLQDTVNEKHLHQVAAVAVLCVQTEPSYRPLIADVVQSLLPLVPQELGGAFRDPKAKGFSNDVSTKMLEFAPPAEAGFIERERHSLDSQRSEYSLSGPVEHSESTPNSSSSLNCSSLGASRSWEGHTRSHLEQQYDCGPGA